MELLVNLSATTVMSELPPGRENCVLKFERGDSRKKESSEFRCLRYAGTQVHVCLWFDHQLKSIPHFFSVIVIRQKRDGWYGECLPDARLPRLPVQIRVLWRRGSGIWLGLGDGLPPTSCYSSFSDVSRPLRVELSRSWNSRFWCKTQGALCLA